MLINPYLIRHLFTNFRAICVFPPPPIPHNTNTRCVAQATEAVDSSNYSESRFKASFLPVNILEGPGGFVFRLGLGAVFMGVGANSILFTTIHEIELLQLALRSTFTHQFARLGTSPPCVA